LRGAGQPKLVNTLPTLLRTSSRVPVARLETPFKIPGDGAVKSWKMKQRTSLAFAPVLSLPSLIAPKLRVSNLPGAVLPPNRTGFGRYMLRMAFTSSTRPYAFTRLMKPLGMVSSWP
jgi:hypothetical protein